MIEHPDFPPTLGAKYLGDGVCRFLVWAPKVKSLELKLLGTPERLLPMEQRERGYFELTVAGVRPGAEYFYRLDGDRDRPDPVSRYQPHGVHRASSVINPDFAWTDQAWSGIPLHRYVTYELHVGTFSAEGTFEGIIPYLDELCELGITAIELMPCAQFPGGRNWGYDGVHPFAVQNTYGGPIGLKRLVDAAHARGIAVVMDVVYNHIGPEGNYLAEFGHYFTNRHHTPWGQALNFDDRDSDDVRRFFIENALYWIDEFHIDALRLDAIHAIYDFSARPFLQLLADAVRLEGERLNRRVYTIAESSLSDPRLITSKELGGAGIDGQWCDDMHHAIRSTLLDDRSGYYADYTGFDDIIKAYRDGFVQDGDYSHYRGKRHGRPARHIDPLKLVVCAQNHDQVGNRLLGERLTELVSFEQLKLAAATVILSPCQPMLFMGEEYAETARFQFFISHTDPGLVQAVREGRKEEFRRFQWQDEPPDPQAIATFERCKLNHELRRTGQHRVMWDFYRRLIELRHTLTPLALPSRERMEITALHPGRAMLVHCWATHCQVVTLFHYGTQRATLAVRFPTGNWEKVLDSADSKWNGPGGTLPLRSESSNELNLDFAPCSVAVYIKQ